MRKRIRKYWYHQSLSTMFITLQYQRISVRNSKDHGMNIRERITS
jgi:hypothetical protein